MLPASTELPNSVAVPSDGGSNPVSIFMVVDLPQPFEPRKPKISPRSIDSVTWSTATKLPNRRVKPLASIAISALPAGRGGMINSVCPMPFFFRQQGDETFLQVGRAGSRHQFRGRSRRQHSAGIHRHDPVPLLRFVHVGRRNEDAHSGAAGADVVDQRPKLAPREWIDAGRWLIENEQVWVVDERAA